MTNITKLYAFNHPVCAASVHKAWPKAAGPVITEVLLTQAATLITRTGTAKHLALAMYLRPGGATQTEVITATGDTQINAFSDAQRLSGCKPQAAEGRAGHKAYALALPAKRASKATGKGNKAKGSKAPAKAATPVSDTPKPE